MAELDLDERGAETLAASLAAAGDRLDDLADTNRAAGALVLGAARIPVRTGFLASTVEVTADTRGVTVSAGAPYAVYVHARNPFLTDALTAREAAVVDLYADAVVDAVAHIKGA